MMNQKMIELAKKLKTLAERGVGGEKENAMQKLKNYMHKHGITEEMLEDDLTKQHRFFYKNALEKKLLCQIIIMVMGVKGFKEVYGSIAGKSFILILPESKGIEIALFFDHYKTDFKKQLDIFYVAYVNKNDIFPEDSEKVGCNRTNEEHLEIEKMMQGIKQTSPLNRIEN